MHIMATCYKTEATAACPRQHPHQLMIHEEDMEIKKQHYSCI